MSESLAEAIAVLAERLPFAHVMAWAETLRRADGPSDDLITWLIESRPAAAPYAAAFVDTWRRQSPTLPGSGVALALESAARVHEASASRCSSIVVTGPTSDAIPVRLTNSVVTEIIRSAKDTLLIVSFAAYGVEDVANEIAAAADRGVRVDLVMESTVEEGGTLRGSLGAHEAFRLLRGRASFWTWPRHRRPDGGSLHAKLLAADRATALVGSANLTGRALLSNIEIGVVLRDPTLVSLLVSHFRALMRNDSEALEPLN